MVTVPAWSLATKRIEVGNPAKLLEVVVVADSSVVVGLAVVNGNVHVGLAFHSTHAETHAGQARPACWTAEADTRSSCTKCG